MTAPLPMETEDHLRELRGLLAALWLMSQGLDAAGSDDAEAFSSVVDAAQKYLEKLQEAWEGMRTAANTP